jgi:hypothetical protein
VTSQVVSGVASTVARTRRGIVRVSGPTAGVCHRRRPAQPALALTGSAGGVDGAGAAAFGLRKYR